MCVNILRPWLSYYTPDISTLDTQNDTIFQRIHTFWEAHHIFGILASKNSGLFVVFCFPLFCMSNTVSPPLFRNPTSLPIDFPPSKGCTTRTFGTTSTWRSQWRTFGGATFNRGPVFPREIAGRKWRRLMKIMGAGWDCHDQTPIFFGAPGSWHPALGARMTCFTSFPPFSQVAGHHQDDITWLASGIFVKPSWMPVGHWQGGHVVKMLSPKPLEALDHLWNTMAPWWKWGDGAQNLPGTMR